MPCKPEEQLPKLNGLAVVLRNIWFTLSWVSGMSGSYRRTICTAGINIKHSTGPKLGGGGGEEDNRKMLPMEALYLSLSSQYNV